MLYNSLAILILFGLTYKSGIILDPINSLSIYLPILCILQLFFVCISTRNVRHKRKNEGINIINVNSSNSATVSNVNLSNLNSINGISNLTSNNGKNGQIFAGILGVIFTIILTPLIFLIFVLFGAPITTHINETFLLSCHFSSLVLLPIIGLYGLDGYLWSNGLFSNPKVLISRETQNQNQSQTQFKNSRELFVFFTCIFSCLGLYLGAIPLTLDWDRDWQKYPITLFFGLYGGYLLGCIVYYVYTLGINEKLTTQGVQSSRCIQ